ncbi:MAG: xanthine dehydrogenase family protein molybdopterin-binding subunit [Candidatus Promineifilaceae bacterium]|jgi:CO/xanthine dehydrogenase Mo-binding subunit
MSTDTYIAQPTYRVDALGKVTGSDPYPGDVTPPNLLHAKTMFSGQPHARMLSMDISRAEALPGVIIILTARDVPVNEYGLIFPDQPVLVGLGSSKPNCDISCWEGDQIAVVVAESEAIAEEACAMIEIEWEQLPVITDMLEARKDEVIIHPEQGSNILKHLRIRKGDMAAGWAAADIVVEGNYHVPYQEHAYLQPEAGVGWIDEEGRIAINVSGQWTHEEREQIAHALAMPEEEIRVQYVAIGGAFGGREDMSIQIVLALAVKKLRELGIERPVRIIWSREESILGHHKRHEGFIKTTWGATKEGKLTAVEAEVVLNSGAYAYTSTKVLGNAHLMVTGPYVIPNAHVDSYAVTTNNVPGGAFRGFGGPQGAFACESQMNKLAEALEIDPVELRLRNVLREGSITTTQSPIPQGVSIAEVVEKCAAEAGWFEPLPDLAGENGFSSLRTLVTNEKSLRRGRGFACGLKNVGFSFGAPESCEAIIELHGQAEIEKVILRHALSEVGQGSHTAARMMAAAAVGVPVNMVELDLSDTATSGNSGSVSASRMTWMAGNSIRMAAQEALAAWENEDRPAVAHVVFRPPATTMLDDETGECEPNFAYGYMAQVVDLQVDIDTGRIHIQRVTSTHDVGQAINRGLVEGQIEGAVVQATGYALMENLQLKDGHILNPLLSQYLIPGISDIPAHVDSVIMEIPDPIGPWGARGVAEMPFIPLAPAIAAALHDATGIWFNEIPLTPDRVIARLREHGIGG